MQHRAIVIFQLQESDTGLTVGFWVAGLPGALPRAWSVGRAGASMVAAAAILCTSRRSCLLAFL